MKKIALMLSLFFTANALCTPLTVRYFQTDGRYSYQIELLNIALDKTRDKYGPIRLAAVKEQMTQSRALQFLQKGEQIDIAFLATNSDREQQLLPIKIPILRGILGYRVFLIHQESANSFASLTTFKQLQTTYKAGFGAHWADLEILKQNGIRVDETVKYNLLFSKLNNKRFDYFPRGINEAWEEIKRVSETYPNLAVEQHHALYYPYPVYFFVNKHNTQLAARIEEGLKIALDDGSFKASFMAYHQGIIEQANLKGRTTFRLDNPTLPLGTLEPDTSWWLK